MVIRFAAVVCMFAGNSSTFVIELEEIPSVFKVFGTTASDGTLDIGS